MDRCEQTGAYIHYGQPETERYPDCDPCRRDLYEGAVQDHELLLQRKPAAGPHRGDQAGICGCSRPGSQCLSQGGRGGCQGKQDQGYRCRYQEYIFKIRRAGNEQLYVRRSQGCQRLFREGREGFGIRTESCHRHYGALQCRLYSLDDPGLCQGRAFLQEMSGSQLSGGR